MAEPARKTPLQESGKPDKRAPRRESSDLPVLQRWVRRPDGRVELLELPLTRELFLDPQLEDKMIQGHEHVLMVTSLAERVRRYFRSEPDTMVLSDMKHLFGAGLSAPAPDVSVVRGLPDPDRRIYSFSVRKQRAVPCLVIEVVSPKKAEIRRTDEVDKVALYERVGIREYLMVHLPRRSTSRLRLTGFHRGADGSYQPIQPDEEGRWHSETTGLSFAVSPAGDEIDIFEAATGRRLLTPVEEEESRRAAEEEAQREAEARRAAEAELARLREEIERLKR